MQQLVELLVTIQEKHDELLTLAERKTPVLIANHAESLNEITRAEAKLVAQIQALEKKREVVMQTLFPTLPHPVSIKECYPLVTEQVATQLQDVVQRLSETVLNLRSINEQNQLLLMDSMRFVQLSLNLMAPLEEEMNYSNVQQSTNQQRRNSMFDSKA